MLVSRKKNDIDEFSTIILGSTIIIVLSFNSSHAEFKIELFQDNDISLIIILTEGFVLEMHFSSCFYLN